VSAIAMWVWLLCILTGVPLFLYLYIRQNDKGLTRLAPEALAFSPTRFTENDARSATKRLAEHPITILDQMPPKTKRRYIVVGGVSLLPFVSLSSNMFTDVKLRRDFLGDGLLFICFSGAKIPKLVAYLLRD
jgi:hypothetical protein